MKKTTINHAPRIAPNRTRNPRPPKPGRSLPSRGRAEEEIARMHANLASNDPFRKLFQR